MGRSLCNTDCLGRGPGQKLNASRARSFRVPATGRRIVCRVRAWRDRDRVAGVVGAMRTAPHAATGAARVCVVLRAFLTGFACLRSLRSSRSPGRIWFSIKHRSACGPAGTTWTCPPWPTSEWMDANAQYRGAQAVYACTGWRPRGLPARACTAGLLSRDLGAGCPLDAASRCLGTYALAPLY